MITLRRTKIIATLGPATDDPSVIDAMLQAGLNIVRVNFSHGKVADHRKRIQMVRDSAERLGMSVAILVDLQGPKIRITRFKTGHVQLSQGQTFIFDASLSDTAGDEKQVGIDYKELASDVEEGDRLSLDDGKLEMIVRSVEGLRIICEVLNDAELSDHKGINLRGGGLSVDAITDKDVKDMQLAAELAVDYVALSFTRSADEVHKTRQLLLKRDSKARIIAKIERVEALDNLRDIIAASDGVMVARGDLAIEIGDEEVPAVQKNIISQARALNKPVITATQMMESMIYNTIPTRAEVSDVANAVLDGTDSVMLSAETAVGAHPVRVIESMNRVCMGAEKHPLSQTSDHRLDCCFDAVDESVAMAAMYMANHMRIKCIISLTESGTTPLLMSRIRSNIPILGLTRHGSVKRRMALYRSVYPISFDPTQYKTWAVSKEAIRVLQKLGWIAVGDFVLFTKGDRLGVGGQTNGIKVIEVSDEHVN